MSNEVIKISELQESTDFANLHTIGSLVDESGRLISKKVPLAKIGELEGQIDAETERATQREDELEDRIAEVVHPYISLERLRHYLFRVTFDSIPEDNGTASPVFGGCSAYIREGNLYRNLDFKYDNAASFIVRTKDFEGMSFLTGLNDGTLEDNLIAQLPYRIVDGRNNNGIMVSTHILFNDWNYTGAGNRSISLTRLPFEVLTRVKSMATIVNDLAGVLGNLNAEGMGDYLIQMLITDGTTTFALIPPETEGQSYVLVDATENPKMTNFRWVAESQVDRVNLQDRPTGVERFNLMPCELSDLRFTKAYEQPVWLSEFIGIRGTDKYSTDAELEAIYTDARAEYLVRQRDGKTWQTMHSVVYGGRMKSLYIQENWEDNIFSDGVTSEDLDAKQDKLIAGEGISIAPDGKTISAQGAGAVRYDEAQSLNNSQKARARQNIGAADNTSVVHLDGNETITGNKFFEGFVALPDSTSVTVQGETLNSIISTLENSISTKQDAYDANLQTEDGFVVGAINEVYSDVQSVSDEVGTLTGNLDAVSEEVDNIGGKIPAQASSSNQLADKDFVNSSINALAAFYITFSEEGDAFPSKSALLNSGSYYSGGEPRTPTKNDYAIVLADESKGGATTRYSFDGSIWAYQYKVNDTPLTAAQLAALNSNITEDKVALIPSQSKQDGWDGKYDKPSGGIPATDLASAVQKGLVKFAEYGVTTYQQISDWFDAGYTVICTHNSYIFILAVAHTNNNHFFFGYNPNTNIYSARVNSSNTWSIVQYSFQLTNYLTTSLTSASTDTQYPSAKAVYDFATTPIANSLPSGGALLPNVFYDITELGDATISCASGDANKMAEYMLKFTTGATAPTITWSGITWASGSEPTIAANKTYEVNIVDGVAISIEY